jgi:pimeloyl-ACP methyl ester carboxylesterase
MRSCKIRLFHSLYMSCLLLLAASGRLSAQPSLYYEMNAQLRKTFAGCHNPNPANRFFYDMAAHMTDSSFYRCIVSDTSNVSNWFMLYEEMYHSAYDTLPLVQSDTLFERAWAYVREDTIPIAIMDLRYNLLQPGALDTGLFFNFDTVANTLSDRAGRPYAPYSTQTIFAGAALTDVVNRSNPVFRIDPAFFFTDPPTGCNTCSRWPAKTFRVDFGDGRGWHDFDPDQVSHYQASYTTPGLKLLSFAVYNSYGIPERFCRSVISVVMGSRIEGGDWAIDFSDFKATFFNRCDSGGRKKFVIYLEGMDVLNNRHADVIYRDMIKNDSLAALRNFGYSFIVVDWKHPYADIRQNARSLTELFNYLKGHYPDLDPLVVVGESMGGLIGRYALRYMESPDYLATQPPHPEMMHHTRLFISLDAPHKGANIPLAYQYAYRYATVAFSPIANAFVRGRLGRYPAFLDGVSTKQMLLYHINTDMFPLAVPISASTFGPDLEKQLLDIELAAIGYPRYCKLVALSNGSWLGRPQTRYWDRAPRAANDYLLKLDMQVWVRVLGTRLLGSGYELKMMTNPDGSLAPVFKSAITCSHWTVKIKLFGLKLKYVTDDVLKLEKNAFNVQPFCTSAGSVPFPDFHISEYESNDWSFNMLGIFWLNKHQGKGHFGFDMEMGIPWLARAGAGFDAYSDGSSFGFVPPMSSIDHDADIYTTWAATDLLATGTDVLKHTPFDVVYTNPLNWDSWTNQSHLNVWNPTISTCASCEGTFDGKPVYSCLLNREIGDDTLWLENLRMKEPVRYEAERALYVNYRNPYYNYPKTSAPIGNYKYLNIGSDDYYSSAMVLSKDSNYVSEDYHKPEFVSNLSLDAYHMIPFIDYNYTTGSMVLCCRQYNTERKINLGLPKATSATRWSVYPSPLKSGETLFIEGRFKTEGRLKFSIYNLLGQEMTTYSFSNGSAGLYQIPLALPVGMYILRADNGQEQQITKFMITD